VEPLVAAPAADEDEGPGMLPAPPGRAELEAALASQGSVSALARHYGRDRRQIYRWLKGFGLK
jgi:transcriptional regulator of acetoin/glycerol metabolism